MPSAPPIVLSAFSGEQPRIIPRLMPETAAQAAIDVRLDDGGLTPMRDSVAVGSVASANYQTIYYYQFTWIGWPGVVNAVPGPVAQDRLYYTGDGAPKMRIGTDIYSLAVAFPANALTATLAGTATGTEIQTRLYAYTFVTALGEESEPSPISNGVDWKPGNTVTLSGFLAAPVVAAPRGPYTQRIYRTQTGSAGTGLYFIAERASSAGNFTDNIAVNAIAEPCPSVSYNAPPTNLEGLIALPNGMMAAFAGKKLYFCEPYQPHAWPEKYSLTMDTPIMGLGAMAVSIVVATQAQPYLVSGTLPETMTAQKIEQNLPCINKRSIVDLGYAIAYASNEGVVVARADGSVGLASANIFNRDDWLDLNPTQMLGGQLNGRYIAFYSTVLANGTRQRGSLFIDLTGQSFLFRSDVYGTAAFYDVGQSAMFFSPLDSVEVRQMDAPHASRRMLYWKSKEFVLPYPENYGAFLVDSDNAVSIIDAAAIQKAGDDIILANQALIAARYPPPTAGSGELVSIGGDIGGEPIAWALVVHDGVTILDEDGTPVAGDRLEPVPRGYYPAAASEPENPLGITATVSIYADKKLVAAVTKTNTAVRLPSGFKARTWEIDISTNARITRITMAKTMDDLKSTP